MLWPFAVNRSCVAASRTLADAAGRRLKFGARTRSAPSRRDESRLIRAISSRFARGRFPRAGTKGIANAQSAPPAT